VRLSLGTSCSWYFGWSMGARFDRAPGSSSCGQIPAQSCERQLVE
jgi:hypothetical protein